jgi:flagellar secretion chaperone FliS
VNAYALRNKLAAYQSVSVHGGVATEDPHRLVLMLMDGALERIAEAHGCIEHGDIVRKAKLLSQAVHILTELRSSLDLAKGGDLARLMSQIRSAWVAVPMALRAATPGQR